MYWYRFLILFKIGGGELFLDVVFIGHYFFFQILSFSCPLLFPFEILIIQLSGHLNIFKFIFHSFHLIFCVASCAMSSYLPFILKHLLFEVDTETLILVIKFLSQHSIRFPGPVNRLLLTYTFKIFLYTFKILIVIHYFLWLYAAFTDLGL